MIRFAGDLKVTKKFLSLVAMLALACSVVAVAQDAGEVESRAEFRSLDQDVQTLKK